MYKVNYILFPLPIMTLARVYYKIFQIKKVIILENQLSINVILNAPWLIALLPSLVTFAVTVLRRLNAPIEEYTQHSKACGIPPFILKLSFSKGRLFKCKPYDKATYIVTLSFSLVVFIAAGWLTFLTSKAYHESPAGWALLKLTSTNEYFLISQNGATSPDRKTWKITPHTCSSETYDVIASNIKSSLTLVSNLCSAITLKSAEKPIAQWITKIHNGKFKLVIFSTPILIAMYWFAISLIMDASLKITIDKYNKQQEKRLEQYIT
jgi:hypothetical protein